MTLMMKLVSIVKASSLLLLHGCKCSGHYDYDAEREMMTATTAAIDGFRSRMQTAFNGVFSMQNESFAMWIALSHPEFGDFYFVFGNSTSSSLGQQPPDIPATLDDFFQIGSISKTFLGTAMLLMEEQGQLSLNDTVGSLVPDFAGQFPQYANYTVENLLRMDTLVGDFLNDAGGILNNYTKDDSMRYSPEEIVAYAVRDGYYPRDVPEYSTTNFIVGEVIVEHVTGKLIQEVVQELIFEPLNLTSMQLPNRYSDGVLPEPAATPYLGSACLGEFTMFGVDGLTLNQDITEFSQGIVMAGTGGAINTNIHDLLAWAKSGTGDALLTDDAVARRHRHLGTGFAGYGIAQYEFRDMVAQILGEDDRTGWRGHAGDAFGYSAYAFHNDDLGASFAGAVNSCSADIPTLYQSLTILIEELKAWNNSSESTTGANSTTPSSGGPVLQSSVAAPILGAYVSVLLKTAILLIGILW